MSGNSVVGQAASAVSQATRNPGGVIGTAMGGAFGVPSGVVLGNVAANAYDQMTQMPSPQAPTPAPTTAGATQTALNQQLQNELQMRASRTLYTNATGAFGGGGLLDNSPAPASRILLGGF